MAAAYLILSKAQGLVVLPKLVCMYVHMNEWEVDKFWICCLIVQNKYKLIAIAQVAGCWLLTVESQVQSWLTSGGIRCAQCH